MPDLVYSSDPLGLINSKWAQAFKLRYYKVLVDQDRNDKREKKKVKNK